MPMYIVGRLTTKEKSMFTVVTFLGMFIGFEGYLNGKLYIGTYTPTCEYGWVVTDSEIYLDTIYKKNINNSRLPLDKSE